MPATIFIKSVLSILVGLSFSRSAFTLESDLGIEGSFGINKPFQRAVGDSRLIQRDTCNLNAVVCNSDGFYLVVFSLIK